MLPKASRISMTREQIAYKELFVGTLIYAVVLGFFNDYTDIVYAKSFSYIFFASLVLEILTYFTFLLKANVLKRLRGSKHGHRKTVVAFVIWFILFASKFVFVWIIDLLFANDVNIYGFFGILLVVASVMAIHRAADGIFRKLGHSSD